MDLFDVFRACFRRWYVVLPLLAIVGWYAHDVYNSVRPVYYSQAIVGVSPPNSQLIQAPPDQFVIPRNGLLDAGGATLITNMAALGLRDPVVVEQVVAAGGKASYGARMFPTPASSQQLPLIMIETTQSDAASAANTVKLAVDQAGPVVRNLQAQAGVPEDQMVGTFIVSPPTTPQPGTPSRTRSTVTIVAAGVGLTILAGVIVDVLVLRWRGARRREMTRVGGQLPTQKDSPAGEDIAPVQTPHSHARPERIAADTR